MKLRIRHHWTVQPSYEAFLSGRICNRRSHFFWNSVELWNRRKLIQLWSKLFIQLVISDITVWLKCTCIASPYLNSSKHTVRNSLENNLAWQEHIRLCVEVPTSLSDVAEGIYFNAEFENLCGFWDWKSPPCWGSTLFKARMPVVLDSPLRAGIQWWALRGNFPI